MNQRGVLTDFFLCKIGVALAALALLGTAFGMSSSLKRTAERGGLTMLADTIEGTIRMVERLPGEVELRKKLPTTGWAEVTIVGERSGETQMVHITVGSEGQIERTLILTTEVNGGRFMLSRESPGAIHLSKAGKIQLELV